MRMGETRVDGGSGGGYIQDSVLKSAPAEKEGGGGRREGRKKGGESKRVYHVQPSYCDT